MSQYINFYLVKNKFPIHFLSFSRNSKVYEAFDDFSKWEYPTLLTENILNSVKDYLRKDKEDNLKYRKKYENTKNDLLTCPASNVAEQLIEIYDILESIDDEKEEIEFCENILKIFDIMKWDMDKETSIFFGVELGEECFKEYFDKLE